MDSNYDLVEELGNATMGATDAELWTEIRAKLGEGRPLTNVEATWLAFKANLLTCDCNSCVERSKLHLTPEELQLGLTGELPGIRIQHVQGCLPCAQKAAKVTATLATMDRALDFLKAAMRTYLGHNAPEKPGHKP